MLDKNTLTLTLTRTTTTTNTNTNVGIGEMQGFQAQRVDFM